MDETNAINKKEPAKGNAKEYKEFSNKVYFSCKTLDNINNIIDIIVNSKKVKSDIPSLPFITVKVEKGSTINGNNKRINVKATNIVVFNIAFLNSGIKSLLNPCHKEDESLAHIAEIKFSP